MSSECKLKSLAWNVHCENRQQKAGIVLQVRAALLKTRDKFKLISSTFLLQDGKLIIIETKPQLILLFDRISTKSTKQSDFNVHLEQGSAG